MSRIPIFLFLTLLIFPANVKAGEMREIGEDTALLIIDVQDFYFPGGKLPLVEPETAAANAARVLEFFRKEGRQIIHVRHNFEPGGSINNQVAPVPGEKVIAKDFANSFRDTELDAYLEENGIQQLVICGMQTHMCVEAATRAASDMGYDCVVIHDACATRDLDFEGKVIPAAEVHASTLASLGGGYAVVLSTDEFFESHE